MTKRSIKSRPHLSRVGLSPKTLISYRRAVLNFFLYLQAFAIELPSDLDVLDHVMSEYINHMWQEGEPHGYAGHLISALSRFIPSLRRHMPIARQYFQNWSSQIQRDRARPFTTLMIKGMVGVSLKLMRYDLALMVYMGFTCLLRTVEIVTLTFPRIVLYHGVKSGKVLLTDTKTSKRKLAGESVSFSDPMLYKLCCLCSASKSGERVYPHNAPRFRKDLKMLLSFFEVTDDRFQAYSLRRGGACWLFKTSQSLDLALVRGRWNSEKAARIYIDEAAGVAVNAELSLRSKALFEDAATWCAVLRSDGEAL